MKLAVLGGGGVRSPLLVASALRRAERIHLEEICLMDINAEKLDLLGTLCRHIARRAGAVSFGNAGSPVRITTTTDPRQAIQGAHYIITTLRVGEEQGRVHDEVIALRHGVLGQETTGPGGFAMAMRSIPAILAYAEMAEQLSPGAWIFNFTNPAGLVTQALQSRGFSRSVGICDGANQAQAETARWLGILPEQLRAEVFGLNHLSWTRRLYRDGVDILPELLANENFLAQTSQHMFDRHLIQALQMWLNEYLYYYYHAERALHSIQADGMTRGEEVLRLNRRLLDQLHTINPERNPEQALQAYAAYEQRRVATYMHYAYPEGLSMEQADQAPAGPVDLSPEEGEGYAGVALNIIEAFETGKTFYTALNVPNQEAIECMRPDDVVEVSCVVEDNAIRPLSVGAVPEHQELLMRGVKQYERLAVEAVLERSRSRAVMSLMAHPLVLSYSLAQVLVDEYLEAHAPYVGEWS